LVILLKMLHDGWQGWKMKIKGICSHLSCIMIVLLILSGAVMVPSAGGKDIFTGTTGSTACTGSIVSRFFTDADFYGFNVSAGSCEGF
jgi:hypothetical protein